MVDTKIYLWHSNKSLTKRFIPVTLACKFHLRPYIFAQAFEFVFNGCVMCMANGKVCFLLHFLLTGQQGNSFIKLKVMNLRKINNSERVLYACELRMWLKKKRIFSCLFSLHYIMNEVNEM